MKIKFRYVDGDIVYIDFVEELNYNPQGKNNYITYRIKNDDQEYKLELNTLQYLYIDGKEIIIQ